MTGIMLGYLISNFLIDSHQYAQWSQLNAEDLKAALAAAGIMTASEFDSLSVQLTDSLEMNEVQDEYS